MELDKKSLRAKLIKDRLAIPPEDWEARSLRICERLSELPLFLKADHIALYRSFRNEVDVSTLVSRFPEKNFYFPRTQLEEGTMSFLRYESPKQFAKNRWGVEEPSSGDVLPRDSSVLIVVPALAYDRKGHRLGYGKGFYDRFLSSFSAATVGVCFSEFFFEALPSESHDRVVNSVVTELGSLAVSSKSP